MKYKIGLGVLLLTTALSMSFMTVAKQPQKAANGVLLCECCGQKDCKCCDTKPTQPQKQIAECGFARPIRVATTTNNRPFGWVEWIRTASGTNLLSSRGFGIDMFEEIAKNLKLRYQIFGYTSDEEAIRAVKKGDLDVLVGIYTPNLTVGNGTATIYPAIFDNIFTVYYPKDRPFEVKGYSSLAYKKGVMRRTENIYQLFANQLTDDISISLETTEDAFKKLLTGEADYLIGSPYSIEAELRRYKLHEQIISSNKQLSSATMFMVLTRATDCFKLKDMLSNAVNEFVQDQRAIQRQINKIIDEWGERFRDMPALKISDDSDEPDKTDTDASDTE